MDHHTPGSHGPPYRLRATRIARFACSMSILMTALVVAVSTGRGRRGEPAQHVAGAVVNSPAIGPVASSFAELLRAYSEYDLPLPPRNARLVRFTKGVYGARGCGDENLIFHLGFLLSRPDFKDEATILVGTRIWRTTHMNSAKIEAVDPEALDLDCIAADWVFETPFDLNVGLATAIQCAARGWNRIALALLELSLKTACGHSYSSFYQPTADDPHTALGRMAWADCANELIESGSDRQRILRRMELLNAKFGWPPMPFGLDPLESLRKTLLPNTANPGSVEALIDDLVELHTARGIVDFGVTREPQYTALLERGFVAVPSLIEHLDDVRLTRSARGGMMNAAPTLESVGAVVTRILEGMSGNDSRVILYGTGGLQDYQTGRRARALAWWSRARQIGEEEYIIRNAIPAKPLPGEEPSSYDNHQIVWIIGKKYPHRLPELYRSLLNDRPEYHSSAFTEAIGESTLEHQLKTDLLVAGARQADLGNRLDALRALSKLDQGRFAECLIETLNRLPSTPNSPYWHCPESVVANLAMETPDPRVWEAFSLAAERSDPALRMELVQKMCYSYIGSRQRAQRLEFAAKFLNDSDVPKGVPAHMFEGPRAGFTFPALSVRNLAAQTMSGILHADLQQHPKADWTESEWEAYREKIIAAYQREREKLGTE